MSASSRLLRSGLYLGDPSITDNFQWIQDGRGHVLTYGPHGDPPSDLDHNVTVEVVDPAVDVPLPVPPQCATLCAIIRIDRNDFWLTPDGGHQGPNAVWKDILDVKPSCTLIDPGMLAVGSDFAVVLQSLHLLTQRCVTPRYSTGGSFFSTDCFDATRFKLRHRLFESIDPTVDGCDTSLADGSPDTYPLEQWPLTKERNRAELVALRSTHRILPLPAYDVAGDLIAPTAYRRCLQGAVAEVHFNLSHWAIARAKRDVYAGEIQFIRVLVPPLTPTRGSKKRKLPLHLDSDDMPSAKCPRS
ncbi:hypothetical protein EDD16DRAFT_1700649 [Pisolithus croceorrhizus]|nr:hypothetical protein EDD16DRAFT_1700649 [Pisolithus croceorrhizus]KAI6131338.1 hypothetical protein EV401DRAFT_2065677 [Pisolithus croceorrhizus]KAI6161182.1 hypothetical protein EDD17DRAFT_1759559 [Pisolithus thermaeus]